MKGTHDRKNSKGDYYLSTSFFSPALTATSRLLRGGGRGQRKSWL
jgi:hypothetical protein